MQSHDELLRRDLAATAAEAEPLGLIATDVVARVARRRRRAAAAGAVATTSARARPAGWIQPRSSPLPVARR